MADVNVDEGESLGSFFKNELNEFNNFDADDESSTQEVIDIATSDLNSDFYDFVGKEFGSDFQTKVSENGMLKSIENDIALGNSLEETKAKIKKLEEEAIRTKGQVIEQANEIATKTIDTAIKTYEDAKKKYEDIKASVTKTIETLNKSELPEAKKIRIDLEKKISWAKIEAQEIIVKIKLAIASPITAAKLEIISQIKQKTKDLTKQAMQLRKDALKNAVQLLLSGEEGLDAVKKKLIEDAQQINKIASDNNDSSLSLGDLKNQALDKLNDAKSFANKALEDTKNQAKDIIQQAKDKAKDYTVDEIQQAKEKAKKFAIEDILNDSTGSINDILSDINKSAEGVGITIPDSYLSEVTDAEAKIDEYVAEI